MMKKTGGAKKPIKMKSGKMPMVKGKDGNMVPAFAADGKGKMAGGGATKKTKAMAKGGVTKMSSGRTTSLAKKSRDFVASIIGSDNEKALDEAAGKVRKAIPDLPGLAGKAEKKRKEAGMKRGGVTKMSEGKRTRRPAPTEKPASKDVLINAIEEDRRIAEANKTAKKRGGGAMKKTKGYSKGGAMKKTKGYSAGGVARGTGAATRGKKFSRSM